MATKGTLSRVAFYKRLQNDVRRAVNFLPAGEKNMREGVEPRDLKPHIEAVVRAPHADRIALRKLRAPEDKPEYALTYDGELLFRLVYMLWPANAYGHEGRWHVRRHPDATWWRGQRRSRGK